MKTKIEFFKDDFIDAIGAGIYRVTAINSKGERMPLYIGESVFVLVRCAAHLYNLKQEPGYFGFDKDTIEDEAVTLRFELIENQSDATRRKSREKELIGREHPQLQSGISDRMRPVKEKIAILTDFLNRKDG